MADFTLDDVVKAVAEVVKDGGCKDDVCRKLGMDPENKKEKGKVSAAMAKLKKKGVHIPDFRKMRTPTTGGLTDEKVSCYNEQLET